MTRLHAALLKLLKLQQQWPHTGQVLSLLIFRSRFSVLSWIEIPENKKCCAVWATTSQRGLYSHHLSCIPQEVS